MEKKYINKPLAFLELPRELPSAQEPETRTKHFGEFLEPFPQEKTVEQSARCMDCGIPFCHSACPLGNDIPAFNEAVYEGNWEKAFHILDKTNNFPEFTGRVCPAPCEKSCVLSIQQSPVSIEHIEKSIIEEAYHKGWVNVKAPKARTGKKVAVIGSGPAGLAAAEQLNEAGHEITIFEKDQKAGGLMRYGIPDFKLEKWVIDRRLSFMVKAGIKFECGKEIGKDISAEDIQANFDAIVLCTGAPVAREMEIPGSGLKGIHKAMEYLTLQNQEIGGETTATGISAKDKKVLVIGGGDTGSDCIGTAHRQEADSVYQITWGLMPPEERKLENPWPEWPMVFETSSSQQEGVERQWNILSKEFIGDEKGNLTGLKVIEIEWETGRKGFNEIEGSERIIPCELALISIGFQKPKRNPLYEAFGISFDEKDLPNFDNYKATESVFVAGDLKRGASLIVWAIQEGREAAAACHDFLSQRSSVLKN
ncbi:MAG: glutamate synthase subunit beta [Bacteroidia bacterium]|nr:glutamate synthase subunit beta [Bacteroidia bacterium]